MIHPFAAAALLVAQAAPAEPTCITHQEAADMAVALLPFFVDAATQRCRAELAANAFLNTGAAAWSARLRQDGTPRRESALRGLAKLGGAAPPAGAEGDVAFQFVAQMMTVGMTSRIRPDNCAQVDTIAQALSPLPTENLARLIVAGLDLGMSARDDASDRDEDADADHDSDDDHDADVDRDGESAAAPDSSSPPICRS